MTDDFKIALSDALEDNPCSDALIIMLRALMCKREGYLRDMELEEGDRLKSLQASVKEMDKQIRILKEELAITQFVEYEVKSAVIKAQAEFE